MDIIKNIMDELRDLKKSIDENIFEDNYIFEKSLALFSDILGEHPDVYNFNIVYNVNKGDLEVAKDIVDKALTKFPFNFDLNTNAFHVYNSLGIIDKALFFLAQRCKCTTDKESGNVSKDYIKEIETLFNEIKENKYLNDKDFKELFEDINSKLTEVDYRSFPISAYGKSMIRSDIAFGRNDTKYFANLYKTLLATNLDATNYYFFGTETLTGDFVSNKITLDNETGDIFAISPVDNGVNVEIKNGSLPIKKVSIPLNKFRYFSLPVDGNLNIESDERFFLSTIKSHKEKKSPKLVIHIFIDGLSQKFLETNGIEILMPNTAKFFKKGYINKNCYANGDWTLPSFASMATGKYTTNHKLFHDFLNYDFEKYNKLIQEYFNEAGYFTAQICNNWRITPSYGYYKGFDRTVYKPYIEGMNCAEVISECIQHIETFKNFNNYVTMTLEELHDVPDDKYANILTQVLDNHMEVTEKDDTDITVFKSYNKNKIVNYGNEIKRLDLFLASFYQYIESNYNDEDFVLFITSDHGQTFLEKTNIHMHESRTKVPFLVRGRGIPNKESDMLMENVDLMPSILKMCDINIEEKIDGKVIEDFGGSKKPYTYTEVFYSGQTYKAIINDYEHIFYFETEKVIDNNAVVNIDNFNVNLINKKTNEVENENEKVNYYTKVVFDHIKSNIKI